MAQPFILFNKPFFSFRSEFIIIFSDEKKEYLQDPERKNSFSRETIVNEPFQHFQYNGFFSFKLIKLLAKFFYKTD